MASDTSSKGNKIVYGIFLLFAISLVGYSFYNLYYLKNYVFIVEAPCDPQQQSCFIRHCGDDEECPPNGFEQFRMFELSASDFSKCSDNSCLNECVAEVIECSEISCDESNGDICSRIEVLTNQDSSDTIEEYGQ